MIEKGTMTDQSEEDTVNVQRHSSSQPNVTTTDHPIYSTCTEKGSFQLQNFVYRNLVNIKRS